MTSGPDGDSSAPSSAQAALVALGTELRRLRQRRGLSQRDLTRLIGLSAHSNLSDYEAGRRLPPADIVAECERVLEVTDGRLTELRSQALIARADQSDEVEEPGLDEVEVAAPAEPRGGRPGRLGRLWSGRMRVVSASIASVALASVVVALIAANSPSPPPPVRHSPNGTRLIDGVDPKHAACDLDAINLSSATLRLPEAAVVDHHPLASGTVIGYLRLRYSPRCHAAWARLDPLAAVAQPGAGHVYIDATRPGDGYGTHFRSNVVQQVYGNMVLTDPGCVEAKASITLANGPTAKVTTRCASPAH
jgi:transcriptional regulator with XRE-family HTH domain